MPPASPPQVFVPAGSGGEPDSPPAVFVPAGSGGSPDAPPAVFVPNTTGGVAATGTINVSASLTSGQTVTIGGRLYTALKPDNGAEAALFADAASLAATINGFRPGVGEDGNVTATVVGTLVTLHARNRGPDGNAVTLAKSGAHLTVSGATLTGGAGISSPPAVFVPGS